jgi:hypothetical protein
MKGSNKITITVFLMSLLFMVVLFSLTTLTSSGTSKIEALEGQFEAADGGCLCDKTSLEIGRHEEEENAANGVPLFPVEDGCTITICNCNKDMGASLSEVELFYGYVVGNTRCGPGCGVSQKVGEGILEMGNAVSIPCDSSFSIKAGGGREIGKVYIHLLQEGIVVDEISWTVKYNYQSTGDVRK